MSSLSTRHQNFKAEPDGVSRYDQDGRLWVKHGGEWMTYPRFTASKYAAQRGVKLGRGIRVEVADTARAPIPSNLTVKPRGGARVTLKAWVKTQQA